MKFGEKKLGAWWIRFGFPSGGVPPKAGAPSTLSKKTRKELWWMSGLGLLRYGCAFWTSWKSGAGAAGAGTRTGAVSA